MREQLEAWLNPLGYTLHLHNGAKTLYSFSKRTGERSYPLIECREGTDGWVCCVSSIYMKHFAKIEISGIPAFDERIQQYIDTVDMYYFICTR